MAGYLRTTSTDDGRGFRYETKMTALAALRLYKSSNEFYLANNFAKGEKFDDIVYTADINGKWETHFIQLKQKQALTLIKKKIALSALRSKGDFVIKKYYTSYNEICKKFQNGGNDVIFSKNINDASFILLTNAYFHQTIENVNPERYNILLETNPGSSVNIKLPYNRNKDVFLGLQPNENLHQFLDNFYFSSKQLNEEDMDSLVQNEIKDLTKFTSDMEIKYVTHELCNFIYGWCKTGKYLTKTHVKDLLSKKSFETQSGKKDDFSFEYLPSFIKYSFSNIKNLSLIFYVSKADSCVMCLNMLKQAGVLKDPNYLTLKKIEAKDIQDHIISEWSSNKNDRTLIVDCEGDNLNINKDSICGFIQKLMSHNDPKRILLVATKKNEVAAELAQKVNAKTLTFNCSLQHLTDGSKNMLMNCEVLFQGYKTKLSSVMSQSKKSLEDVFTMVSMTELLQGRLITVGIKPVEHIPYYVTRVLTRQSTVSFNLFQESDINACFALSGLSLEKAIDNISCTNLISSLEFLEGGTKETPKIIILEGDPNVEFEAISKKISVPLHWFEKSKKVKNMWNWKKSTKGIEKIAKYVENVLDYVATDNIMEINDKIVVVTAEPGMGKSTLLNHLAAETKRLCPYVWVISIVLNDNTEFLDRKNFLANAKKNTMEMLASNAGVNSTTSKFDARLFEECYNSGNMIVLLDGFDEIVPYYTQQGLAIIEILQNSPVSRVWVSARPVLRELLENKTSTLSYTIKPFETKDQSNFLAKYWKSQMPGVSNETLASFITQVLTLINESFDEKLHQFTGIPLQTRMLAEVFYTDLKSYHDTEKLNLKQINGVELFEKFVYIKRGIQLEKAKITISNAMAKYDQQRLDEAREQDLMYLALLTLLPRNKCKTLKPGISDKKVAELKKYISDGNEKTGIVMSFKGDTPQFIHRTFAEYFTALYFTKHFRDNRDFLSSDDFSSETFEFVKYFFDRILARGLKLHEAVLARDEEEVEALLKNDVVSVDTLDKGGRTALHIAAAMPRSQSIIELLINKGCKAEIPDDVLAWKPMQYASKLGVMENISPILEKTGEKIDGNFIPITWESLLKAVQGDYLQTLLHLIDNGIYSIETLDELSSQKWLSDFINEGLTILHLAAAYNAIKILRYFLQKKSRDSKLRLIELKESTGLTPLLLAGSMGNFEAVECLLEAGANSLVSSPDGKTLTQYAVACRNVKMFGIAVKKASDHNVEAKSFLPAVKDLISDKSEWGSMALQLMFSLYPDLYNMRMANNQPLLIFACIKGNALAVKRLVELGADVNVMTDHGTPLHYAVTGGHKEVVSILLANSNVQVDALDNEEMTPLYKAVMKKSLPICQMLIEAKADVNKKKKDVTILISAIADIADVTENDMEVVRLLLSTPNIELDVITNSGLWALWVAISKGFVDISEMLVEAGANIHLINQAGDDLTHAVAISCSEKLFYFLLVSGFDFERKNNRGITALSMLQEANAVSLINHLSNPNKTVEEAEPAAEPGVKKLSRKEKKIVQQNVNNIPTEKTVPPKRKAPNPPQPKKNQKPAPKEAIYSSDAFMDILKDLKETSSLSDDVAEKLKSFINLAISAAKPQEAKQKIQPPSRKQRNANKPPKVDNGGLKTGQQPPKGNKKPPPGVQGTNGGLKPDQQPPKGNKQPTPPVQNNPKVAPKQKQPPPSPKPASDNKKSSPPKK